MPNRLYWFLYTYLFRFREIRFYPSVYSKKNYNFKLNEFELLIYQQY